MMKKPVWTPVAAAFIRQDGHVLIGKRPPKKDLSGLWEFPGGKIEPFETPQLALQRELVEELGIHAQIGPLRLATSYANKESGVVILFYDVLSWEGEPQTLQHTELKWIKPNELKDYKIPKANEVVIDDLISILSE